jgi:hypothetical protein
MKACEVLRHEVMAYIGEHYEPERDADASLLWGRAVDHALGRRPESLDEAQRTWLSAVGTELVDLLR